jgi:uncharacterized protein (TIGR03382 family)
MRTLAFAVALLVPAVAGANSCPINHPLVESYTVPLGCSVVIHVRGSHSSGFAPILIADRGGENIDITGTVDTRTETLPITFLEYDADCNESFVPRDEPFVRHEIQLAGTAQVGDQVHYPAISVVAAGPCPAAMPPVNYSCSDTGVCSPPDADGDGVPDAEEDGGCSAGGGGTLGLGLALLALVGRRRSRTAA